MLYPGKGSSGPVALECAVGGCSRAGTGQAPQRSAAAARLLAS